MTKQYLAPDPDELQRIVTELLMTGSAQVGNRTYMLPYREDEEASE